MKIPILSVLSAALLFIPSLSNAQTTLTSPLQYGMVANPQVVQLQDFLRQQGLFAEQSTGNYYTLTQNAVKQFQQSVGIETTGYFGPLTAAAANAIVTANTGMVTQTVTATKSLLTPVAVTKQSKRQSASLINAFTPDELTLTWQTNNYPTDVGININLLRKVSDSPVRYEFVRTIAVNTPNDNSHTWALKPEEVNANMYVEITCSDSFKFINGCSVGGEPLSI